MTFAVIHCFEIHLFILLIDVDDEVQDDLRDGKHRRHTTNAIILVGCKVCIPFIYF